MSFDTYLDPKQAALYLGISTVTLNKWRYFSSGPPYHALKYGKRALIRYTRTDLDAWMERARIIVANDLPDIKGQHVIGKVGWRFTKPWRIPETLYDELRDLVRYARKDTLDIVVAVECALWLAQTGVAWNHLEKTQKEAGVDVTREQPIYNLKQRVQRMARKGVWIPICRFLSERCADFPCRLVHYQILEPIDRDTYQKRSFQLHAHIEAEPKGASKRHARLSMAQSIKEKPNYPVDYKK